MPWFVLSGTTDPLGDDVADGISKAEGSASVESMEAVAELGVADELTVSVDLDPPDEK